MAKTHSIITILSPWNVLLYFECYSDRMIFLFICLAYFIFLVFSSTLLFLQGCTVLCNQIQKRQLASLSPLWKPFPSVASPFPVDWTPPLSVSSPFPCESPPSLTCLTSCFLEPVSSSFQILFLFQVEHNNVWKVFFFKVHNTYMRDTQTRSKYFYSISTFN